MELVYSFFFLKKSVFQYLEVIVNRDLFINFLFFEDNKYMPKYFKVGSEMNEENKRCHPDCIIRNTC